MFMDLNKRQKEILDTFFNKNICFVNASAGTGKTTTIVEAYIELLERRENVSGIVVITFTKAAANEMLFRIRSRVRNKISICNGKEEKEYWNNVYNDLISNARISTIHSFALSIVNEYSLSLSMPPRISIMEEENDFKDILYDAIIRLFDSSEYAKKIYSVYRLYLIENRDAFINNLILFLNKIKPRIENIENFENKARDILNVEESYLDIKTEILNNSSYILEYEDSKKTVLDIKNLVNSLVIILKDSTDKEYIQKLDINLFNSLKRSVENVINKKAGNLKKDVEFIETFENIKSKARVFLKIIINTRYGDLFNSLILFIKESFIKVESIKKSMGVYSHEDIISKAIEALESGIISESIRSSIGTIILDEAQDTSRLQFSFINLLIFGEREIREDIITNNKKRLLIVGDRKQSIYRFRNADVYSFLETQKTFLGYLKYLKDNYRSSSMLIEFFNDFFFNVVFKNDPINYNADDNLVSSKVDDKKSVIYLLLNTNTKDSDDKISADERASLEAYSIAKYISEHYNGSYENISILLPTFKRLNVYLKALSIYNIPFYVDGGSGFYRRDEIIELSAFIRYLILHENGILSTLLTYPFFDITIDVLYDFIYLLNENKLNLEHYFSIYKENGAEYKMALDIAKKTEYFGKLKSVRDIISELERVAYTLDASSLIETVCIKTNYYNYLMTKEDGELSYSNVEKLKSIAEDFEKSTGKNAYDFALHLEKDGRDTSYSSIPKLSVKAIKVMTIHKSKGLEFDTVFFASLGHTPKAAYFPLDFIDEKPYLTIPTPYYKLDFSLASKLDDKNLSLSEKRRLLYVALTRSANNLILSGETAGGETYRKYFDEYYPLIEKKTLENNVKEYSEDIFDVVLFDDKKNNFINAYIYGRGIKEIIEEREENTIEDNIEICKKEAERLNNDIYDCNDTNLLKGTLKTNEPRSLVYLTPSGIYKDTPLDKEHLIYDIKGMLQRKPAYFEEHGNVTEDYVTEDIIELSPIDIGIVVHSILENFNFEKYFLEKEQYIENIIKKYIDYYKYYDNKKLKEIFTLSLKNFMEYIHVQNIIAKKEYIVSREHSFQKTCSENGKLYVINGKIDLITKDSESNYYVIDYKTSYYDDFILKRYDAQLKTYKSFVSECFEVEENKVFTDILCLRGKRVKNKDTLF